MKWSVFAHLAQLLAPTIITTLNPKLAPLAGSIASGIAEAEEIPGASGKDKLQHVLNIVDDTAAGVNSTAGKQILDPNVLHAAATEAINTTVEIINLAHPVAQANLTK
jgi:hypothetical protein